MKTTNLAKRKYYIDMPADVRAVLDLFPDFIFSTSIHGDYFDVLTTDGGDYVFCQPFPGTRTDSKGNIVNVTKQVNKARFISWVRAGMPSGHDDYNQLWEKEDYDGWE